MKIKPFKIMAKTVSPATIITEPYIEIMGNREFVFTGKTEITELDESVLKIKSNEHRIFLFGKNMEIIYYTFEGIKIRGEIEKIEFKEGG
jgi:sporulation protein YqfC